MRERLDMVLWVFILILSVLLVVDVIDATFFTGWTNICIPSVDAVTGIQMSDCGFMGDYFQVSYLWEELIAFNVLAAIRFITFGKIWGR